MELVPGPYVELVPGPYVELVPGPYVVELVSGPYVVELVRGPYVELLLAGVVYPVVVEIEVVVEPELLVLSYGELLLVDVAGLVWGVDGHVG